jgi:tetratricopeptide (TPR) repeat protein
MQRSKELLYLILTISFLMFPEHSKAQQQQDKPELTEAGKKLLSEAYDKAVSGDFAEAEAAYRQALAITGNNSTAAYNLSNLYLDNDESLAARRRILEAIKNTNDKDLIHKAYHNLGNSLMKEENYKGAIEAYKNALRNNPDDEETRYNYALAKEKQKKEKNDDEGDGDDNKQENQDQDQKEQDQDQKDKSKDSDKDGDSKDQKDKGDQKDQENKDKGDQNKDKSDEKEKGKDQQDKKDKEQNKSNKGKGEQEKQKPQKGKLSPEQVQRLLKAIENQEDQIQQKINAKKAKGSKVKTEKDW